MHPEPLPAPASTRQMESMSKRKFPLLRLRRDPPAIWLVVGGFAVGSVFFHFGLFA